WAHVPSNASKAAEPCGRLLRGMTTMIKGRSCTIGVFALYALVGVVSFASADVQILHDPARQLTVRQVDGPDAAAFVSNLLNTNTHFRDTRDKVRRDMISKGLREW